MRNHSTLPLLAAIGLVLSASGCSNQCKEIRAGYEESLQQQSPFQEIEGLPVHIGVALRSSLINKFVGVTAQKAMKKSLTLADKISIGAGKSISIRTDGDLIDMKVLPHAACDTCLQFNGKLDGKLDVKVPGLPIYHVPLTGTASFVAPLEFEKTETGAAVVMDAEKIAELGKSNINAEIAQLPPTWTKILRGAVSDKLLQSVGKSFGRIRVFEFAPPSLGIEGLEVLPAKIMTDAKSKTVWLGFATNLRGVEEIDLKGTTIPKQNFALSVHPSMMVPTIEAAMRSGKVSRTYNKSGKAKKDGQMAVTMNKITVDAADGKNPFRFGFRLWNMPKDDECYWVDAEAAGDIKVTGADVTASIDGVELKDSSMSGIVFAIAKWSSSSFLDQSREIMSASFAKESFKVPGAELTFGGGKLTQESSALVLRANVAMKQ